MNSVNIIDTVSIKGNVQGTTDTPSRTATINIARSDSFTASGTVLINQVLDKATVAQTLAAGATLTIDLTTGQTNPLGESISGAGAFAKVREIYIAHDGTSLSSGIVAYGAASNSFQAKLSSAATITLKAGEYDKQTSYTAAGMTVDSTHKTLQIVNSDGTNAATIRYFVSGSV